MQDIIFRHVPRGTFKSKGVRFIHSLHHLNKSIMARQSSTSNSGIQYTMHSLKIQVQESEMPALAAACERYEVQAHRSLMPVTEDGSFEVLLQFSSIGNGLHIALLIGKSFGYALSLPLSLDNQQLVKS